MSCHLPHRLTRIHRAVSVALLCSVGYVALLSGGAQAATIGKTVITSAQHEPLSASIMVTDIDAANFSARLANAAIYQQMGLSPTDSMTVRFQPTSATTGRVVITTTKPVSKPFADVVLAINDGNQSNVIPKTLLMPLNDSLPIAASKNIVSGAKKPNLPVVSTNNAQPLTLREGAPPPLVLSYGSSKTTLNAAKMPERNLQLPNTQAPTTQSSNIQAPSISTGVSTASPTTKQSSNSTTYAPSRLENGRLNSAANIKDNTVVTATNNNYVASSSNSEAAKSVTDKQLDILNIQITRQIQPKDKANTSMTVASPMAPKDPTLNESTSTSDITNTVQDVSIPENNINSINAALPPNDVATKPIDSQPVASKSPVNKEYTSNSDMAASSTSNSSKMNYTVQRNDNLWVIAKQIAEKNNIDVQTVMKEIQVQNPDAFINKNIDQLKADAQLSLPDYDVLPSQQKLEAAINAQKQYRSTATKTVKKKPTASKPVSKAESVQAAKNTAKPAVTKTQILPKAQFSVLAPGHEGRADGTKTKAGMTTGNGLSTDVLTILKSSRQSTASQAKQLAKTNGTLDSYTRKLQLQNQKLAELEARLKELKQQK